MAERKRKYTWFVEALDSYTNMAIAREMSSDTNFAVKLTCGDGTQRNLWEVGSSFLAYMKRSKNDLNLKFNIFVREGNGKIRLWKLWEKS